MSNEKKNRKNVPMVLVTVSGGVANLICKPAGLVVRIYDYDVQGCEEARLDRDPDDQPCMICKYPKAEVVVANKHWAVIRHAVRDLTQANSCQWKCPDCGRTIECSYEQIVEIGTPHCPHCEIEMTMA